MNQWREWLFASCVLAVCKPTRCILPPTALECVLYRQTCLVPVRNSLNVPSPNRFAVVVEENTHKRAFSILLKIRLMSAAHFGLKPTPFITSCELCTDRSCTATILHLITPLCQIQSEGIGFFFSCKNEFIFIITNLFMLQQFVSSRLKYSV